MKTFDAETHTYRAAVGRVPGATDIIKSQGLVDAQWMTEEARWRGKCVHRGIELLNKKELDWKTVDESIVGYLTSYSKFVNTAQFQMEGSEEACFADSFACMPDLWGILNFVPTIIELKTGPVPYWAAIQTALQRRALIEHCGFTAVKRFGLQLMADGSLGKLKPFANPRDDRIAMSMVDAWWWKRENGYIRSDWK